MGSLVVLAMTAALAFCLLRRRRLNAEVSGTVELDRRYVCELDAKAAFTEMPANSQAKLVSTPASILAGFETPVNGSQCPTIHEMSG